MEGLQRSAVSFRRQGSSGLIWDDKFLQAEIKKKEEEDAAAAATDKVATTDQQQEKADSEQPQLKDIQVKPVGSTNTIERSRSNGGGRAFRTGKVSPAIEPPSPKVSACGFCSAFGKPNETNRRRPKSVTRRTK